MKPRLLALAIVLALIAFSGCVSVDAFHHVNRDGSSLIIQKIDFTNLPETMSVYGSGTPAEFCQKVMNDNPGLGCTFEAKAVWLDRTVTPDEDKYLFNRTLEFPYSVYRLEVRTPPIIVSTETSSELGKDAGTVSDFKEPYAKPTAAMLRVAGIKAAYTIQMPGEITSAENGAITVDAQGRTYATYDILELMEEGEYMIVTSKELDLFAIGIAVAAIGLFVGGIGVALVLKEASEKKLRGGFGRKR